MTDIAFPPRNETLDFLDRLNREKYHAIGAPVNPDLYIDTEGLAVWTQEYLRRRVNGEAHLEAAVHVFQEIDRVRGSASTPHPNVPSGPRPVVAGRLRIIDGGTRLANDAGPWRWKLVTAFDAPRRFLAGELEALRLYADWTRSVGGNGWRVFAGWSRTRFDYREQANFFGRMEDFLSFCRFEGLYVEVSGVQDGIPAGVTEQRDFLNHLADGCAHAGNALLNYGNEPWKNGLDPTLLDIRRPGLLTSRGAAQEGSPLYPSAGYTTIHPPRSDDWARKVGKDCYEVRGLTGDFVVADEPKGASESRHDGARSNDPSEFFTAGAGAALFTAGATCHGDSDTMQLCQVPGPIESACVRAFFAAMDRVPIEAPTWTYARYGNSNPGVPMPVQPPNSGEDGRMHAMLGPDRGVVINYEDVSGWTADGRHGWTVSAQHANLVLVSR